MSSLVVIDPTVLANFRQNVDRVYRINYLACFFTHAGISNVAIRSVIRDRNYLLETRMIGWHLSGIAFLERFYEDRIEALCLNLISRPDLLVREWNNESARLLRFVFLNDGTARYGYCPQPFFGMACTCWPIDFNDRAAVYHQTMDATYALHVLLSQIVSGAANYAYKSLLPPTIRR